MSETHTTAWHAVPDAVAVARQLRPADLRGLPATLRYGASLSGVALAAARGRPRTTVLVDDAGPVTGAALESAIDAVAGELARLVRRAPRRRVGICCEGHRGYVAAVTAAGALGIDVTVVPPRSGRQVLTDVLSGMDVVVVDESTTADVRAAAPHATLLDARAVASREPAGSLRSVPRPRRPGGLALLTSGTTGAPRLTHRGAAALGQLATVLSLMHGLGLHRDEPVLVAPPLGHGHGLSVLTAALVAGAPAVLAQGRDGAEILDLVHRHAVGVLAVVPAQLVSVLDALDAEVESGIPVQVPPSLRRVATGSAPMPTDLVERTRRLLGDVLVDFYGASEVGTATIATPQDLREAPGTVGRPAAGVRIEVVDDDGVPVPVGTVGRVRVHSPWRAESTVDGADVGDLGHLDADGRLFLDGRADEVAVVGGHNVPVRRVREWFAGQPGVDAAHVGAVDHPELGQELVVRISGQADLDELASRARAELGSAVAPRRVERATLDGDANPAALSAYDPAWPRTAQRLLALIRRQLADLPGAGAAAFDHIGSTAVPGLAAKPIVDLQVRILPLPSDDALAERLEPLGYRRAEGSRPDSPGVHRDVPRGTDAVSDEVWVKSLFVSEDERVILHIRRSDSPWGRYAVWFRDWLRAHPQQRDRYEQLKLELSLRNAGKADYDDYTRAKTVFFDEVQAELESWGRQERDGPHAAG